MREGIVSIPPPVKTWGRFLSILFKTLSVLGRFQPVEPDIVIEADVPLDEFGIHGRILSTPGHTPGSGPVLLETGEAFVGDLAVNSFPFRLGLGIPAVAEDVQTIYESWKKLLSGGAATIYPGHGKPFAAEHLRRKLAIKT
jgi:glyoxylase-like metal-dependent hydrolase (beta-lactamase superfamily II)